MLYHFGKLLLYSSQGHIGQWPGGLHSWVISNSKLDIQLISCTYIQIFLFKYLHYGRFLVDHWKRLVDKGWEVHFLKKKIVNNARTTFLHPRFLVLELVKDADSVKKNLDQSEASFELLVWASTMQAGLWLVKKNFLQNRHPWPILRLRSKVQKSCLGVISDFFPQ